MTANSELANMLKNTKAIYNKLAARGATITANKNLDNVVNTIDSLEGVEANFVGLANELRQAYGWSYFENIGGKCFLYDYINNITSEMFNANSVYLSVRSTNDSSVPSPIYIYAVIDGKLYLVTSSGNSIILTQQGVDTDWEKVLIYPSPTYYSKGGYIGQALNNLYSIASETDFKTIMGYSGSMYYINNGKIYQNSTLKHDGNWLCFYCYFPSNYGVGISNNKIAYYHINNNYFNYISSLSSYTITDPNLFTSNCNLSYISFGVGSTIYMYNYSNNGGTVSNVRSYTFDSPIKKIYNVAAYSTNQVILLENHSAYLYNGGTPSLLFDNIKDIFGYCCSNGSSSIILLLSDDNKIYNQNKTLLLSLNFSVDIFNDNLYNQYIQCFKIGNNVYQKHDLYTIPYINDMTTAYKSISSDDGASSLDSHTSNTITVDNKTYNRDMTIDSTFEFVPDDFKNHDFDDTSLIQEYLNA